MVTPHKRLWAGLVIAAALTEASVAVLAAAAMAGAPAPARMPSATARALLHSRELWATVDVCSPADQRNTVGVRGSMPGDGSAHDKMYMSFRLQYMAVDKRWTDVASASSGWELVGDGSSPRQGGGSFGLKTVMRSTTFRGVVDYQWRHGKTVLLATTDATSVGHKSLAGADPANFSAASCVIA
jgi:hypothetical protein